MDALIIAKSTIRKRRQIEAEIDQLSAHPVNIDVRWTEHAGHATELALAHRRQYDAFIAIGGDGTLNEVMNGLLSEDDHVPLVGVFSGGTANDFAAHTGEAKGLHTLLNAIERGKARSVDAGLIEFDDARRWFVNVADAGLGPAVLERVSRMSGRLGADTTFTVGIINALLRHRAQQMRIAVDEEWIYDGPVYSAAVGNSQRFGSGIYICPDARIDDGFLNLTIIGDVRVSDYLRQLPTLKRGDPIDHPQVHYFSGRAFRIEAPTPVRLECDGEISESTPVKIRVVPKAWRLLSTV